MATTEEKEVTKAENRTAYARRLAAALGNGADWSFDGEMAEDPACQGRCACGHEGLRFLFTLTHKANPARREIVGSSCVLSYPGISPEVVEGMERALDAAKERAAEARRKCKAATDAAEVQALISEWSAIEWACDRGVAAWNARHSFRDFQPRAVYLRHSAERRLAGDTTGIHPRPANPQAKFRSLKSAAGQKAALRRRIEKAKAELAEIRAAE